MTTDVIHVIYNHQTPNPRLYNHNLINILITHEQRVKWYPCRGPSTKRELTSQVQGAIFCEYLRKQMTDAHYFPWKIFLKQATIELLYVNIHESRRC